MSLPSPMSASEAIHNLAGLVAAMRASQDRADSTQPPERQEPPRAFTSVATG